ncbi:MAG: lipocalin family protein [Pseudomonadota bacterium]
MRNILASFLVLFLAGSCGGDGGASTDALAQTWEATKVEYSNSADLLETVDLVALGGTFRITLAADGSYQSMLAPAGEAEETHTGTWEASQDLMTLTQDGQLFSTQYDYVLSGDTLTLTGGDSEYDFDGDTVPEAAKLDMTFQPNAN